MIQSLVCTACNSDGFDENRAGNGELGDNQEMERTDSDDMRERAHVRFACSGCAVQS